MPPVTTILTDPVVAPKQLTIEGVATTFNPARGWLMLTLVDVVHELASVMVTE